MSVVCQRFGRSAPNRAKCEFKSVVIVGVKEPFPQWVKSLPDPAGVSKDIINCDNIHTFYPIWTMILKRKSYLSGCI